MIEQACSILSLSVAQFASYRGWDMSGLRINDTFSQRTLGDGALFASAVLLLFMATACASGTVSTSAPEPFDDIPAQFVASSRPTGEIDSFWWEEFGDQRLDAIVEQAVIDNPSIGQAVARVRQARAEARLAGADLYPNVDATLGAAIAEGGDDAFGFTQDEFDLGIGVSWEADLWGRISSENAAARAEFLASAANLQAARQFIAAETVRTYFALIEAQAQAELSRRVLETYDELIRQLTLRVAAGITPQSLNALAISDQQVAQAGLEDQRAEQIRLTRQLEILLGDYPDGSLAIVANLPDLAPTPVTGVPAALLARRPDIRAARLRIEAAGYRIDAAEAAFLPSLTLTGSAGTSGAAFADLFDPGFFLWRIAGRLLQPIFQGGRLRAQLDLRQGEGDEAIEFYGETALQALFEVETALAVDRYLDRQEQAFDLSAAAAEQSVDISTLRFRAGVDSFFNVLESQQRALNARSAYLTTRRLRLFNRVDLHLAIGGGFEEAPDASLTAENSQ